MRFRAARHGDPPRRRQRRINTAGSDLSRTASRPIFSRRNCGNSALCVSSAADATPSPPISYVSADLSAVAQSAAAVASAQAEALAYPKRLVFDKGVYSHLAIGRGIKRNWHFLVSVIVVVGHLPTPFKIDSSVPPGAMTPHQTFFARRITYSLHHIARCLLTPVPDSTGESKSIRPASTLSAMAGGKTAGMPPGYTATMRRFFAKSRRRASRSCGLVKVEITGGGSGG